MALSEGTIGASYRVTNMNLPAKMAERLTTLGLIPGVKVSVLNAKHHGVLIVKFRGTRFALGRTITQHIEVEAES